MSELTSNSTYIDLGSYIQFDIYFKRLYSFSNRTQLKFKSSDELCIPNSLWHSLF